MSRPRWLPLAGLLAALCSTPAVAFGKAAPAVAACGAPTRFTVVDEGTPGKPDILLIPGLTSSRRVWAGEAARLASDYRFHLVQLNGFAGQPAGDNANTDPLLPAVVEDLHAYLSACRMRPIVIGHSLGGLLALQLAKRHREDVAKMVVVDANPFVGLMFGPQATLESVRPTAEAMRKSNLEQTPAQREATEARTAETLALSPEARKLIVEDGLSSDRAVFARAFYEDMQTDLRPELPGIKTRTLVLYAFDPTLTFPGGPKPTAEMVDAVTTGGYRGMPNVELVRVDASRHFIMFDQPETFHRLLQGFLREG